MYSNHTYLSVTEALPCLLSTLDEEGLDIGSRAGRTREITHVGITLTEPLDREILCDHRKANLAAQIAETMWVLSGRDDIAWLENYLPRVRDFSDDGTTWRAGYGARLRGWEDHGHAKTIDQWRWLIGHLKEQPASRRAVMSIWDPTIDTEDGKDIPCNDWLSFLSRNGYLDLHVAIRSNDVIWGWSGINQFEWSSLLEITAGMLGMKVGSLHFSTTSFHLYDHHFAKAEKIRTQTLQNLDHLYSSPRFDASVVDRDFDTLERLFEHWFQIEYDIRTGSPLVQHYVDTFPEPMLRSWLRILQWWWSEGVRADEYLEDIKGTRLQAATLFAMQPKRKPRFTVKDAIDRSAYVINAGGAEGIRRILKGFGVDRVSALRPDQVDAYMEAVGKPVEVDVTQQVQKLANSGVILSGKIAVGDHTVIRPEGIMSPFMSDLCDLHLQKEAAYGGSWKKRGELFSILPNIGRKVDRLGTGGETDDETSADTAGDLFVYLAKYHTWLTDEIDGDQGLRRSDAAEHANEVMRCVEAKTATLSVPDLKHLSATLQFEYEHLLTLAQEGGAGDRRLLVEKMLPVAYSLARALWEKEKAQQPGGSENPLCRFCGSAKSNHVPGGSRWTCQSQQGFEAVDQYRGADVD